MKYRGFALLPFFVFIVVFAGAGIISRDFYSMPAYVAFIIALFVALLQNRGKSFEDCRQRCRRHQYHNHGADIPCGRSFLRHRHRLRRRRKHSEFRPFHDPASVYGSRDLRHRLLHLPFNGNIHGNHHRTGTYSVGSLPAG